MRMNVSNTSIDRGYTVMQFFIHSTVIKRKETSCGFFEKLFHGEEVAKVEQRLFVKTTCGDIFTAPIVEIVDTGKYSIAFQTEDGGRYEVFFSTADGRPILHNLYANAKVEDNMYISSLIKQASCYPLLQAICG